MPTKNFTDKTVAALKALPKGQVDYYDQKNPRFGLRVSYSGTKTWFVFDREPETGKRRRVKLGRYPEVKLADARKLALTHKHAITVEKRDPVAERKADRNALTFARLADLYMDQHAREKKRTWREDGRMLSKYFAPWHGRNAAEITRPEVVAILQDVKKRHGGVMANRCLACVRTVFNWAIRNGFLDQNAAYLVDRPAKEVSRDRVFTELEIKALWSAFSKMGVPGNVYQFCLVTAQRLSEVRGIRWDEVHEVTWTIPSTRTKNGRTHVVPLSSLAQRILADVPPLNENYVFGSPKGLEQPTYMGTRERKAARRLSNVDDFTPHDLRRTFRTNVVPLGFDRHIGEKVLNHTEQGVAAVYDRHSYASEKRDLLEAWGRNIEAVVGTGENVVQLKGAS